MKKKVLLAFGLMVICTLTTYGQITYSPKVRRQNNSGIIEKVELTANETIVTIKYPSSTKLGAWVSFSPSIVLVPSHEWDIALMRQNRAETPTPPPSIEYLELYNQTLKRVNEIRQLFSDKGWLIRNLGSDRFDTHYKIRDKDREFFYFELHFDRVPMGITDFYIRELVEGGFEWEGIQINNPKPAYLKTGLTESELKNNIDKCNDGITGIYETSDGNKYKLACIKEGGTYKLIYLDSEEKYLQWEEGDVKAVLRPSATPGLFKADWYMLDTSKKSDVIVGFKGNSMDVVIYDDTDTYIKMYPTISTGFDSGSTQDSEEWTGTCFAIGKNWLATNYHVVEGAKNLVVCGVNGDKNTNYTAEVVLTDKYNDLAIMRITDSRFRGFNIKYGVKMSVSEIGTDIFVLGYPLTATMGEDIKLTTGVISSKTGFQGDVSSYQISAPIQPGNSGGPLFDKVGNLIGIVNAKHKGAENVGYAIKLSYLKNLIDSSNERIELNCNNIISTLSLTEKVKAISSCVLLVKANTQIETMSKEGKTTQALHEDPQVAITEDDKVETEEADSETLMKTAMFFLVSAEGKYREKDYDSAYEDVCFSVKLFPTPQNQYLRGILACYHIEDSVAIESFEYCLERDYRKDDCIFFLARCHMDRKEYTQAIFYLDMAIANDRKDIESFELRGRCKSFMGQEEQAIIDYRKAIKFDGIVEYDYSSLYNLIAFHMMNKGNYVSTSNYIEKALKHNPLYGNAWDTYGELNYRLGNYEECIRCMNIAITNGRIYKGHWLGNSYLYRGLARKKLRNMAGAYQDIEKAIDLEEEGAAEELAKIDASRIDFSKGHTFSKIIQNPSIKKNSNTNTEIRGVEITDEFVALHLCYQNTKYDNGGWYSMDANAYIRDQWTGKKYKLIATENCAISPDKTPIEKDEKKVFTLYFEPISSKVREIDFVESDNSTWKFYGILLVDQ